jgi:hypothetical protein
LASSWRISARSLALTALQRRQHQGLARAGEGLGDEVLDQGLLQLVLRLHGRSAAGAGLVAGEQALGVHDLQLAQHGGVAGVGALGQQGLVHGLGVGRAERHSTCSRSSSAAVGRWRWRACSE